MTQRANWKPRLALFQEQMGHRMQTGMREYGDASFSKEPLELIRELQEEAMDLANWGFILWDRLEQMKRAVLGLDHLLPARQEEVEL